MSDTGDSDDNDGRCEENDTDNEVEEDWEQQVMNISKNILPIIH